MTRFEGSAQCGKTSGVKLISTVIYGSPQQKYSTEAANYSDGTRNPLIALDNIETKHVNDDLEKFMVTCVTGIAREKRKAGSDTDTVVERPKCLLNTTGIEPLGGGLTETLSRSFIIRFAMKEQANSCFLEAKILAAIREKRDLILSGLIKNTSQALAMMRNGAQEKVMNLLFRSLGNHAKKRNNDYLSLMYLMAIAGGSPEETDRALNELDPGFKNLVEKLNEVSSETARESNPTALGLITLFKDRFIAGEADRMGMSRSDGKTNVMVFLERYQIEFEDEKTIRGVLARDLFVALKRVAKEHNLHFPFSSVQQFSQRFKNDLKTIEQAGFQIAANCSDKLNRRISTYDLDYLY